MRLKLFGRNRKTRKQLPVPKVGERFREEHLTPTAKSAFRRISEIYGIPVNDLLPRSDRMKTKKRSVRAQYNPLIHNVLLKEKTSEEHLEHELIHSIQKLLAPNTRALGSWEREFDELNAKKNKNWREARE